jgi:hypothetical protein
MFDLPREHSGDKRQRLNPRWKSGVSVTRHTDASTHNLLVFALPPAAREKMSNNYHKYKGAAAGDSLSANEYQSARHSALNQTNSSLEMQALPAWQLFIFTARMFVCTWRRENAHLLFSSEETPLGEDFWNHARMLMSALCHIAFYNVLFHWEAGELDIIAQMLILFQTTFTSVRAHLQRCI